MIHYILTQTSKFVMVLGLQKAAKMAQSVPVHPCPALPIVNILHCQGTFVAT